MNGRVETVRLRRRRYRKKPFVRWRYSHGLLPCAVSDWRAPGPLLNHGSMVGGTALLQSVAVAPAARGIFQHLPVDISALKAQTGKLGRFSFWCVKTTHGSAGWSRSANAQHLSTDAHYLRCFRTAQPQYVLKTKRDGLRVSLGRGNSGRAYKARNAAPRVNKVKK